MGKSQIEMKRTKNQESKKNENEHQGIEFKQITKVQITAILIFQFFLFFLSINKPKVWEGDKVRQTELEHFGWTKCNSSL